LGTNDGIWEIDENQLTIQPFTKNGDKVFQKSFHCLIRQMVPSPDGIGTSVPARASASSIQSPLLIVKSGAIHPIHSPFPGML
jgi:hypothetical protein